ncbi:LysM peptidoglycan-binding domain-containing protein [Kocuria sp. HSID16901]|uniref:LysM peptidoglycan-binding domain-containing protein n=1 Tax=Kocuria sp. HSID16901 TaxID=2419505 RepID=UPI000A9BAAB0|nr:LysM peptidoglycan-binding domain-containing protein [Kocuria sp. HSID16901]
MAIEGQTRRNAPTRFSRVPYPRWFAVLVISMPGLGCLIIASVCIVIVNHHPVHAWSTSPALMGMVLGMTASGALFSAWWCIGCVVVTRRLTAGAAGHDLNHDPKFVPRFLLRCIGALLGVPLMVTPPPAHAVTWQPEATPTNVEKAQPSRQSTVPSPSPLFKAPSAQAEPTTPRTPLFTLQVHGNAQQPAPSAQPTAVQATGGAEPATPRHPARARPQNVVTVERGESVWSISKDLLGAAASPSKVRDLTDRIIALNQPILHDHPDLIYAGTRLHIPADSGHHGHSAEAPTTSSSSSSIQRFH